MQATRGVGGGGGGCGVNFGAAREVVAVVVTAAVVGWLA